MELIISSTARETSSINTGWNFVEPSPKSGTKNEVLNIGKSLFKKISPPPIITPGLMIIALSNCLKASFSDLCTAILLVEFLSISTPRPEKRMNCFSSLLDFKILISF